MYSGSNMEANHGINIEAHSGPKMEAQNWRSNDQMCSLQILPRVWKLNPNEKIIWTRKRKGPQLTQMFQRLDNGKIMQAHSSPKLEEQNWSLNMVFAYLVKRMQTWATEAQNLKGP